MQLCGVSSTSVVLYLHNYIHSQVHLFYGYYPPSTYDLLLHMYCTQYILRRVVPYRTVPYLLCTLDTCTPRLGFSSPPTGIPRASLRCNGAFLHKHCRFIYTCLCTLRLHSTYIGTYSVGTKYIHTYIHRVVANRAITARGRSSPNRPRPCLLPIDTSP